jgi:gamma-glutamyltranspeptidase/glutathione hydrolase
VAQGGKAAFYQGAIAEAIAAVVQSAGGCLTVDDLAAHHSTWDQPISTTYRGLRVWECPPNGQGLAALIGLNILEGFDLQATEPLSADSLHLQIEAMRLAFADVNWYVADPHFNPAPLEWLLSKEYAAERRRLISQQRATLDFQRGAPVASSDTIYLSVVDAQGNACSLINSNYMGFGTGIVPSGYGFTLQNRGHGFSLQDDHPNALAPRKRPYHTIIPAMITVDSGQWSVDSGQLISSASQNPGQANVNNQLLASFGVMGGFMQPQGHLQVVSGLADHGLDAQAVLDRPRFCIQNGDEGGGVALEDGIAPQVLAELIAMGHPAEMISGYARATFGRGQVILRQPESGVLWGGSDPRTDGCAMSL